MSKNLTGLKQELVNLFVTYGVVPQGYDFDLWTREQQEQCARDYPESPYWEGSFEDVVETSVNEMLGLK